MGMLPKMVGSGTEWSEFFFLLNQFAYNALNEIDDDDTCFICH